MVVAATALDARAIDALCTRGFAKIPHWMPEHRTAEVLMDVLELDRTGLLAECSLGREGKIDTRVRRSRMLDLYHWDLSGSRTVHSNACGSPDTRFELCKSISSLQDQLSTAFASRSTHIEKLAPFHTETHYLSYPDGGHYRRHLDVAVQNDSRGWSRMGRAVSDGGSFSGSEARRTISFLLYLNPGWEESMGGALRIFDDRDGDRTFDILPEAGTLVLFDSCRLEHEVRPTLRSRQCVVGWFKSVREREAAPS